MQIVISSLNSLHGAHEAFARENQSEIAGKLKLIESFVLQLWQQRPKGERLKCKVQFDWLMSGECAPISFCQKLLKKTKQNKK